MTRLDVAGVAYLCVLDDVDSFIGRLITTDRHQYSIQGHRHKCDDDNHIDVDQHTCCFDETSQMINMTVSQVDDLSDDIVIPHVMKSGGDNFSLTSKSVEFITDELVIGEKASAMVKKYISSDFTESDCLVCIGQMTINYPSK